MTIATLSAAARAALVFLEEHGGRALAPEPWGIPLSAWGELEGRRAVLWCWREANHVAPSGRVMRGMILDHYQITNEGRRLSAYIDADERVRHRERFTAPQRSAPLIRLRLRGGKTKDVRGHVDERSTP